ncbi:MAG: DUF503 domain-containing protein [Thermomicrobia bacterium]|nr:DUF503 domain-containing protein [Thermomicrobia bacterium]
MIVGVARITLELPGAHSLKEKRSVVKSLLARLQNRFNVSAVEVAAQDTLGIAVIGITCTYVHFVRTGQRRAMCRCRNAVSVGGQHGRGQNEDDIVNGVSAQHWRSH